MSLKIVSPYHQPGLSLNEFPLMDSLMLAAQKVFGSHPH